MNFRDTATAFAQRASEKYVGVVLYTEMPHAKLPARWDVQAFPRPSALEEWYEEIAPSNTLYDYIAAFDKTRDAAPVGESVAPSKFGKPGFSYEDTSRWRYSPYRRAVVSGDLVGGLPRGDASEIIPGLFVGSKPSPGRHDGIDAIVLAAMEYQPPAHLFPDIEVIHAPLDDAPGRRMREDEIEIASRAAKRVARLLREGRRVLSTCQMGLNRSSLVAALAMHDAYGMSADEIITRLRRARGSWALSNQNFEKLLRVVIAVKKGT